MLKLCTLKLALFYLNKRQKLGLLYAQLLIRLLFLQVHRETDPFFAASGVQLAQSTRGFFHFRLAAFSDILQARVGNILAKDAALRITLNSDGAGRLSHLSHMLTHRIRNLLVY